MKRNPQRAEMIHTPDCWKHGQHHYECALEKITQLQTDILFWRSKWEETRNGLRIQSALD